MPASVNRSAIPTLRLDHRYQRRVELRGHRGDERRMPRLRNGSPFPMRKDVQLVLTASTAFTPASTSAPAIPSPMAARTALNEGDFFANVLPLTVTRFT